MRSYVAFFFASIVACVVILTYNKTFSHLTSSHRTRHLHVCSSCGRANSLNSSDKSAARSSTNNSKNFQPRIIRILPGKYLPVIETRRLILREFTSDDLDAVHAYGSQKEVSQSMTYKNHTTKERTKRKLTQWLEGYAKNNGSEMRWAMVSKAHGGVIGCINLHTYNWYHKRCWAGYSLNASEWGKGYTTEAMSALIEYAFTHLDLLSIGAVVRIDNAGSCRVMEKSGASVVATLRDYWLNKGVMMTMHQYHIRKSDIADRLPQGSL